MNSRIIGIDIGNSESGIVVLINGLIGLAKIVKNHELLLMIAQNQMTGDDVELLIEDMQAYNLKMTPEVILTCKYLGKLEHQLQEAKMSYKLILRSQVKQWVFNTFPDVVLPIIKKKIVAKDMRYKNGDLMKPHYMWVNDAIIVECMRIHWEIGRAKPGKRNLFGLSSHSWQALALVSYGRYT